MYSIHSLLLPFNKKICYVAIFQSFVRMFPQPNLHQTVFNLTITLLENPSEQNLFPTLHFSKYKKGKQLNRFLSLCKQYNYCNIFNQSFCYPVNQSSADYCLDMCLFFSVLQQQPVDLNTTLFTSSTKKEELSAIADFHKQVVNTDFFLHMTTPIHHRLIKYCGM